MTPGIFQISMAEYMESPAVSASVLKRAIAECPRAAWSASWLNPERAADAGTKASDAGSIAHSILLEGSTDIVAVIDPMDHPAEKTGAIPIGWTNKSIKAARDAAKLAGKIPVLLDDMKSIENMVDSAWTYIESVKDDEPAIWEVFQQGKGESELTMVWQDGPTLCRMRPDRISLDRKLIVDVKTTQRSAEPGSWGRAQLTGMGYYTSAAFYRRGVEAICKVSPEYVFLVIEQEPPYLCSLVGMDPKMFEIGGQKIETALAVWADCVKRNRWPAYPTRVCYPELPAWEEVRWLDEQAARPSLDRMEELGGQA